MRRLHYMQTNDPLHNTETSKRPDINPGGDGKQRLDLGGGKGAGSEGDAKGSNSDSNGGGWNRYAVSLKDGGKERNDGEDKEG